MLHLLVICDSYAIDSTLRRLHAFKPIQIDLFELINWRKNLYTCLLIFSFLVWKVHSLNLHGLLILLADLCHCQFMFKLKEASLLNLHIADGRFLLVCVRFALLWSQSKCLLWAVENKITIKYVATNVSSVRSSNGYFQNLSCCKLFSWFMFFSLTTIFISFCWRGHEKLEVVTC